MNKKGLYCNVPLFISEISTIYVHGRSEDMEELEHLLESHELTDAVKRRIAELANSIRKRRKLGYVSECCDRCPHYSSCERKWLKQERMLLPTCCERCLHYEECKEKKTAETSEGRKSPHSGGGYGSPVR